jgi:glucosamine--fructose-6-phosphate aminotransferase (isomerizing)
LKNTTIAVENSIGNYTHWTIKEIYEQIDSINNVISYGGRLRSMNEVKLGGLETHKTELLKIDNLILLGCGTSYYASMLGLHYFKDLCNFNCVLSFDGAEFTEKDIPLYGTTTLILLSQSGETKDLYRCIQIAKEKGLFTIGVVNVVDSLIAREVNCGCYLNAGREVAVASTKSFTSQCILLSMISIWFSQNKNIHNGKRLLYIKDLYNLQKDVIDVFDGIEEKITKHIDMFNNSSCFLLGKGKSEAIAKEGALKIKEITYIHSEGYSTSSLKHGPFALLTDDFPVIIIALNDEFYTKNENAYNEIKSRNAKILFITDNADAIQDKENVILIPENRNYGEIFTVIILQLLAYKLSIARGINPDFPKNLAKVVTVE